MERLLCDRCEAGIFWNEKLNQYDKFDNNGWDVDEFDGKQAEGIEEETVFDINAL